MKLPRVRRRCWVFTQYREITDPLARHLAGVFGQAGLILHGGVPVGKRKELVDAFQRDGGPPFFVLSLKAGGTGLNLTAASHVIHFDRWWNPAVENQATDRAFRIGQKRNVMSTNSPAAAPWRSGFTKSLPARAPWPKMSWAKAESNC